jgi:hypothetical protein
VLKTALFSECHLIRSNSENLRKQQNVEMLRADSQQSAYEALFIDAAAVIVYSNHFHKKMEHCKKLLICSNVILRQFLSA